MAKIFDVMQTDDFIIDAVKSHDLPAIEKWSKTSPDNIPSKDPLIEACKRGYLAIVKVLLNSPNININNKGGKAFLFSARRRAWDIVDLFLEHKSFIPQYIGGVIRKEMGPYLQRDIPSITFKIMNKEDILSLKKTLEEHLTNANTDIVRIATHYVYNVGDFAREGFFPSDNVDYNILEDYIKYESYPHRIEILDFWHSFILSSKYDQYEDLNSFSYWSFSSLSYKIRKGVENCCSFGLSPSLLFPNSKRPFTGMSIFKQPNHVTYKLEDILSEKNGIGIIKVRGKEFEFFRVTRYAKGMSRGMYYGDNKGFGGTFFYLEKDSNVLLLSNKGRSFIFKNKLSCVKDWIQSKPIFDDKVESLLTCNISFYLTPSEIVTLSESNKCVGHIPNERRYAGKALGLYALEDVFDQEIYRHGKHEGVHVVVFEEMVGSRQIVPEVFDLRQRKESFSMLAYLEP